MAKPIKKVSFENKDDKIVLAMCNEAKLSVSSVKYSGGHDGDCMNCNIKVGAKIVGTIWDDSYGGGFDVQDKSQTIKADGFNKAVQGIMEKAPLVSFDLFPKGMSYSYDMVVDTMITDFNIRKDCKKKILVKGTKIEHENARVDELLFNVPFDGSESQKSQVRKQMTKQGYITYEIVNERLV